ncbi:MAG: quinolinate synthetase [Coxiella sp. DG_40]|nr:MAG: quinolinate synthetase [Coxiella sp. DG_40]
MKALKEHYVRRIEELRKERNAVILAHVYQIDDIQDIADFVGDSLELSRKAVDTDADTIVFCGVRFMAETAAILNPDKIVLLPEMDASCELADMAAVEELKKIRKLYPEAAVVSYVNSSAAIKAESNVCCTSANAVEVVNNLGQNQILFVPDRNLGSHVAERTGKDIIKWNGYCYVHEKIGLSTIKELKQLHPDAELMVHPECTKPVRDIADYVGSTAQMLVYAAKGESKEFIVGTEDGLIHTLQKANPNKKFYPVTTCCRGMKRINLEEVSTSLEKMRFKIDVRKNVKAKAKRALERMLVCK